MALTDKLSAIGNAIREKTGKSELLTLDAMPLEIANIESGGDIPEEALKLTGNQNYKFPGTSWNWVLEQYGDRITTEDITSIENMFSGNSIKEIPFAINTRGDIVNASSFCNNAKYIREIEINATNEISSNFSNTNMFYCCHALRKIKGNFFSKIKAGAGNSIYGLGGVFSYCAALDEIVDCPFVYSTYNASYSFDNAFRGCGRLKKLTFKPYTFTEVGRYKGATIDLTNSVGYCTTLSYITDYSPDIKDKRMNSAETLAALYDDPDCWTSDVNMSRYNHDSAVETINSLPDVTAASSGGISTIKFKGQSGASTPAGAINTLTEEEIAVATAKGWTVSLV